MVISEAEVICKKHPNQPQQPGVCSSCVREKLLKLSSTTEILASPFSSSSLSSSSLGYYSSASSSGASSSTHRRNASDVFSSIALVMKGNSSGTGLKKSSSMAFVARNGESGKKKGGFWCKLLRSTRGRTKGVLMHSTTAQERQDY